MFLGEYAYPALVASSNRRLGCYQGGEGEAMETKEKRCNSYL